MIITMTADASENELDEIVKPLRADDLEARVARNTLDIAAVALVKELSHLPVIVDPSHATGVRSLVAPCVKAALAVGADGVIVEVHPQPELALSDGAQSLTFDGFARMTREISESLRVVAR